MQNKNYGKVAIILPAYNEEQTIQKTLKSFYQVIPEAYYIVVDNASTDMTASLAKKTIVNLGMNGKVIYEGRPGKANAIRAAFSKVDADIYIMADADMTYPANQIYELIDPIYNENCDMVVGDRHAGGRYARENKRLFHDFGNKLIRGIVNWFFNAKLSDVMSGYRSFSRVFVKNYPVMVEGFELEVDMTLYALDNRFTIHEIPINYTDRPEGSFSKLNTLQDGMRIIKTISQILRYHKPMVFFGWLACFSLALAFLTSVPVIEDWYHFRYIYHIPLAILSSGLVLVSSILFAVGLILDSISHFNKMEIERKILGVRDRY